MKWKLRKKSDSFQTDCKNIKEADLPIITVNSVKKIFAVLNEELQYKEWEQTKSPNFLGLSFSILWCEPGSNRRHKDFQSFALPTELPHHIPFGAANIRRSPFKIQKPSHILNCFRLILNRINYSL